ncbi:MAG: alpha-galactosidase [Bacilli bacterium]|jgi:alpha-galactosidase|nr:alpha-galactosidase [Bacilli bacterium]MCH4210737.1 alpha-galactosidase [Bacilli bacterium]MCH4228228.1 alpha-galactosidase [Bacilli bacterium]MCI2055261.1 alpha-galactosidase [Bacilli bacterium]
MITNKDGYFLLSSKSTSLLLHVNEIGKLVCEYYGKKIVSIEEAPSLTRDYACIQGTSIAIDEKHQNICLDYLKNEVSTLGKGDYGVPSLLLKNKKTAVFDFTYKDFTIRKPEPIKWLPTPHGASEELLVNLLDEKAAVKVVLHYFVYEESDVIGRYLEIVNLGDDDLTVERAMSLQLVLVNEGFSMVSLYGGWANENNKEETKLGVGRYVNSVSSGLSSNRHNPFFALKSQGSDYFHGHVYGFNLVYSGNHEESVEVDSWQNVRIQQGISPLLFKKSLSKSASFATPMCVMSYSDGGLNGLSRHFQSFVNNSVIPARWNNAPRPIVYNNWEATMFNFTKGKLISLMKKAKEIGAETFVLDDGWFGKRNDDSHGLGDWSCNLKKIPGGLASLAKAAKKEGLKFGIWMEPEMVNPDSDLYRAHPEYAIKDNVHEPSLGRHQMVLDLSKKEVQDFVYSSVSNVIKSADISFLKWDCNRTITDFPLPESFFHDYVLGLYAVLERLIKDFPNVLFENCASGGNRYDLGMLSYFPQSWMSDDTDSYQRLFIQSGAALGYPLSSMSNHVAAKTSNQLLRLTALDSKFDVASFGVLGYELDLNDLTPLDLKTIKKQTAYYKKHRLLFQFGSFDLLSDFQNDGKMVFESSMADEAVVGRYNAIQSPAPKEDHLFAVNLTPDSLYDYEVRPEVISFKKFGHLVNMISPVHIKEDGFIINTLSKYKAFDSEKDKGLVSGSALESGLVPLSQEWSGVGLNERIRLMGDFGGRIYYIHKHQK